jgi:DNA-binding MltR family transcriptional regulator
MALVYKDIQELEELKEKLRNQGKEITEDQYLTKEEKQKAIGAITDHIYDIENEIARLKKIKPTVIQENTPIIFLSIAILGIFLLTRKK